MNESVMKMVFTLKSGKSIVIHMFSDQCLDIYNQVKAYNSQNKELSDKIHLCKKQQNEEINEAIVLFISELAAIQINRTDIAPESLENNIYQL